MHIQSSRCVSTNKSLAGHTNLSQDNSNWYLPKYVNVLKFKTHFWGDKKFCQKNVLNRKLKWQKKSIN